MVKKRDKYWWREYREKNKDRINKFSRDRRKRLKEQNQIFIDEYKKLEKEKAFDKLTESDKVLFNKVLKTPDIKINTQRKNILALSLVAGLICVGMVWVDLILQVFFKYNYALIFSLGFIILYIGFMYINKKWEGK